MVGFSFSIGQKKGGNFLQKWSENGQKFREISQNPFVGTLRPLHGGGADHRGGEFGAAPESGGGPDGGGEIQEVRGGQQPVRS